MDCSNTLHLSALLLFLLTSQATSLAKDPVIPSGREPVIIPMLDKAFQDAGKPDDYNITIDGPWLILTPGPREGSDWTLRVGPGQGVGTTTMNGCLEAAAGVLVCLPPPGGSRPDLDQLARGIAESRDSFGKDKIWEQPEEPPLEGRIGSTGPEGIESNAHLASLLGLPCLAKVPFPLRALPTWLMVGYLVVWLLHAGLARVRGLRAEPQPNQAPGELDGSWWLRAGLLVTPVFIALAWFLPDHVGLHDHNTFVGRADCAWEWSCDLTPYSESWMPPTYHAYGLLLRLIPQTTAWRSALSIALSALTLVLLRALILSLYRRFSRLEEGRIASFLAPAALALHPVFIRLAAADTFWPFTLACLLASGLVFLNAGRIPRPLPDRLAAAVLLYLAAMGNYTALTWTPLLLISYLAWSGPGHLNPRALLRLAATILAFACLALPYVLPLFRNMFLGENPEVATRGLLKGELVEIWLNQVFLMPGITSAPLIGLFLVGIPVLFSRFRMSAPILWALVASHTFLGRRESLLVMDPTNYIHFFPSIVFSSFFVGAGGAWLLSLIPGSKVRRIFLGLVGASTLALIPAASTGWDFLFIRQTLDQELLALGPRLDRLPEHDLLVVPPHFLKLEGHPEVMRIGDPVEAFFPVEEYLYRCRARGMNPPLPMELDRFLEQEPRGRILFYQGSPLFSFLTEEVNAGIIPDSLRHPILNALEEKCRLEPVETWELPTSNHPARNNRVMGDRSPVVQVGFFMLDCGEPPDLVRGTGRAEPQPRPRSDHQ